MYPNDARLRNMNYGVTIHYDIHVEYSYFNGEKRIIENKLYEKIYLGRFPIMLHSNLCILRGMSIESRFNVGECRNDYGGYFIISGKEKVIVSQEKFGDNMLYVRKYKDDELYSHSCEIHSVSEDSSKPIRYTSVKIVAPDASYSNKQIVVDIPNVKKPIPLFILMRALGVISDKSIIEFCLLDLKTNSNMIDLFIPSIHDANNIFTQQISLEFIAKFTKRQTISSVQDILMNYFLPHIGEDNFINKAYFIGFMVNKLLRVFTGKEAPTDRDNFKFKRIETSGSLIYDLFREYFLIQNRNIFLKIDKEYYYHAGKYRTKFVSLVEDNIKEFFKERIVEDGFKKGFKGNWGSNANTKRVGLVQDLNRLSWFTHISHLRKINLPLDPTAKVVGPHLLHSTQWGFVDPVDTPDGGNIGLHKHLSISTSITNSFSSYPIIKWIRANTSLKLLTECSPNVMVYSTKVFVNGNWIGVLDNPIETVNNLKLFRRNGIIPVYTSISFSYETNIIYIYTDGGRLTRPIFYRDQVMNNGLISYNKLSYEHGNIKDIIDSRNYTWTQVISGFEKKNDDSFNVRNNILYDVNVLYPGYDTLDKILDFFEKNRAIIDYVDTSEEESALICTKPSELKSHKYYTHCEIDPSLIFGVMGNSIIYPETNQFPRDCFSCGQSRQAVSVYHSNSQMRMDKMGVILNYGQTPIVKSRYLEYINREEQPYGFNAIVAIMSYTGYNVEDAILINEGSVKRGIFRTTYYTTYESREESSSVSGSSVNTSFANIETKPNVKGIKEGFDYSKLDIYGLVKENTEIDDRIVLIGEVTSSVEKRGTYIDNSKTTKKGQLGFVDKSFISEGEEGFRIAKVRIREERLPAIGDKMACALPTQQVLTNKGWIEIQHIDIKKHKVATLDKNGMMCYEYPISKFEYNHDGEMYYIKNENIELICTLNHKLYVKSIEKSNYELIQAEDVIGKTVYFQKSMENVKPDINYLKLDNKLFKMDIWLQLLGMFIINGFKTSFDIYISSKLDKNILEKLEINYEFNNNQYIISKEQYPELYEHLNDLESLDNVNKDETKYFPDYIWNLSKRQSTIFLNSCIYENVETTNLTFANNICRLSVHCGLSGNIKVINENDKCNKYYKIDIVYDNNQPCINMYKKEDKLINYNGKVYCIEMPSSHLYYMRENNYAPSMLIGNSRAGQKGTIGLIIPEKDMPFTSDGIRPDLIINPHAIPSRMTIGQLVECLFGKVCCMYGGYGDCTAFATNGSNYDTYGKMLTKIGYHNSGNQILYNGFTGEQIYSEIFIGPTYYMRLKHMVKDKINYRATGKRNFLTRQTNQGRANDGGLKIGEMERDGIMAHGLSYFLNESYMVRGDQYYMGICNKTGAIAIYNPDTHLFLSPFADGPLVFKSNIEGQSLLSAISKFGRSFSIVKIPFSLKLLIQELQVMNVQMRIITEDNIDQLFNLSYQSRNIDKLLNIGRDGVEQEIKVILENYKREMDSMQVALKKTDTKMVYNDTIEYQDVDQHGKAYWSSFIDSHPLINIENIQTEFPSKSLLLAYVYEHLDETSKNHYEKLPSTNYKNWFLRLYANRYIPGQEFPGWEFNPDDQNNNIENEEIPLETNYVDYSNISPPYAPDSDNSQNTIDYSKISPPYAPDSDNSQSLVGGNNLEDNMIFEEESLNNIFNKLEKEKQEHILKLPQEQREIVIREIMRRSSNKIREGGDCLLVDSFQKLPLDKQFLALQGGYNSMAKEFAGLAKKTPDSLVTIKRPIPISEQLIEKYPMLSIKDEYKDEKEIDVTNNDNNENKSTNDSSIKNISI